MKNHTVESVQTRRAELLERRKVLDGVIATQAELEELESEVKGKEHMVRDAYRGLAGMHPRSKSRRTMSPRALQQQQRIASGYYQRVAAGIDVSGEEDLDGMPTVGASQDRRRHDGRIEPPARATAQAAPPTAAQRMDAHRANPALTDMFSSADAWVARQGAQGRGQTLDTLGAVSEAAALEERARTRERAKAAANRFNERMGRA